MAGKLRRASAPVRLREVLPLHWQSWSDRAICSRACGGQCCKGSVVPLTEEEAGRLPVLARSLGLPSPPIFPAERVGADEGFLMQARPCVFLSHSNLCQIYRDRPAHCRAFPYNLREWCPLSVKRFGGE